MPLAQPANKTCWFSGAYHDEIWGTPLRTSRELFAQLSLASQQAGVSWSVIWDKREGYRAAFHDWDIKAVAAMTEQDIDALLSEKWAGRIMRARKKLAAIVHNARICAEIEASHPGGLAGFLWSFADGRPETINTELSRESEAYKSVFGVTSRFSDEMEQAMKRSKHRGANYDFRFLGSTTLQAFALQVGLLNGHSPRCPKNPHYCGGGAAAPTAQTRGRKRGRSVRSEAKARVPHAKVSKVHAAKNDRSRGATKRRVPRRRAAA